MFEPNCSCAYQVPLAVWQRLLRAYRAGHIAGPQLCHSILQLAWPKHSQVCFSLTSWLWPRSQRLVQKQCIIHFSLRCLFNSASCYCIEQVWLLTGHSQLSMLASHALQLCMQSCSRDALAISLHSFAGFAASSVHCEVTVKHYHEAYMCHVCECDGVQAANGKCASMYARHALPNSCLYSKRTCLISCISAVLIIGPARPVSQPAHTLSGAGWSEEASCMHLSPGPSSS